MDKIISDFRNKNQKQIFTFCWLLVAYHIVHMYHLVQRKLSRDMQRNERLSKNNRKLMNGLTVHKAKSKMNFLLYRSHLWKDF